MFTQGAEAYAVAVHNPASHSRGMPTLHLSAFVNAYEGNPV
jgi:hypothetical protein